MLVGKADDRTGSAGEGEGGHAMNAPSPTVERPRRAEPREAARRYATPTGAPCPFTVRLDGAVEGDGACRGCGTCLLGAGWES